MCEILDFNNSPLKLESILTPSSLRIGLMYRYSFFPFLSKSVRMQTFSFLETLETISSILSLIGTDVL